MTKTEALDYLKQQTEFEWGFDEVDNKSEDPTSAAQMDIYVNEIVDGKKVDVLFLIWKKGSLQLNSIVFYPPVSKYLAGEAKKLLTTEVANTDCTCKNFATEAPKESSANNGLATKKYLSNNIVLVTFTVAISKDANKIINWFTFE